MNHDRNLLSICQAVEKANANGISFVLSLIGEGTERMALEKFALQTAGRIRVMPPVAHDQIPKLLAQAHIGVAGLALLNDKIFEASSPIKFLEYMAAGLPILCSRNACYTDVVGNEDYVFWIEDTSADGLLSVLRLAWQARASLPEMGCKAISAAKKWSWKESTRKLKASLEYGLAKFNETRNGFSQEYDLERKISVNHLHRVREDTPNG
jgi:glycosyltransferase involved in cell wall biosynthesis